MTRFQRFRFALRIASKVFMGYYTTKGGYKRYQRITNKRFRRSW